MVDPRPPAADLDAALRSFQAPLRAFLAKRVASPAEVDDLLQEVLIRIARDPEGFGRVEHVRAWVHRVARNVVVDHYRARGRSPVPVDQLPDPEEDLGDDATADNRRALAACLSPLVGRLDEPYREAVRLTELEGLTQAEAAGRVGLSLSGMKSRVQRGREQLRRVVLGCCEVELDRRRGITRFASRPGGCGCSSP